MVQVLKEPGRPAQSKSYLWAQMNGTGPPARLFGYAPTRGAAHALTLYAGSQPDALAIDQRGLGPAQGVGAISLRVSAEQADPTLDDGAY